MALRCRKDQSTLSPDEKSRLVGAYLALKANGKYDQYVLDHVDFMGGAHQASAFLPWHREYLRRLELDLQLVDASVTLPYWDWSVSSATSSIWDPTFMGGNGRPSDGRVMTGSFAFSTGNWTLASDGPALRRRFGVSPLAPTLPAPSDVLDALDEIVYDVSPWNTFSASGFRNKLEGWINGPQLHNRVHVWVGGSMVPASSPNDPVFFLHHCFIDKLWADWQRAHPGLGYEPMTGAPAGHNGPDQMQPWAGRGEIVTPLSVLDHHALGYAYDNEPECRPTLKLRDDLPTLKVRDDLPTLKTVDDLPTLKLRDDLPTLKLRDDLPTLKARDDLPTTKFRDDVDPPTLKARDDGATLKAADDLGGGGPSKPIADVKTAGLDQRELPRAPVSPFVLSTPHHSMAWTRTFPEAARAELAQLEQEIAEYEEALAQVQADLRSPGQLEEAQALRQDLDLLLTEHQTLHAQLMAEGG